MFQQKMERNYEDWVKKVKGKTVKDEKVKWSKKEK